MQNHLLLILFVIVVPSYSAPISSNYNNNYYPQPYFNVFPLAPLSPSFPLHQQPSPAQAQGITFLLQDEIGPANLNTPDADGKDNNLKVSVEIGPKLTITNLIQAIPFLPIEINVPAVIGKIVAGIRDLIGSIRQRVPIFNNVFFAGQPVNGMMLLSNVVVDKHEAPIPVLVLVSNPILEVHNK